MCTRLPVACVLLIIRYDCLKLGPYQWNGQWRGVESSWAQFLKTQKFPPQLYQNMGKGTLKTINSLRPLWISFFFLKKKIINYWGKFLSILFPWWFINDYIYLPNIEISINWFDMKEGIKRVPWNRVLYYTRFEPRIFRGHILEVERGGGDISHSTYVMMEKWPYMCFSSPCYRKS